MANPTTQQPQTSPAALITGASRGLGLALARRLAADGWRLLLDARDAKALASAHAELAELAPQAQIISLHGDVTDQSHQRKLAKAARDFGGLDALVNNASALGPSPLPALLDAAIDDFDEVYRTNVFAPLALIQLLWPTLKPDSRILNITSDAGVEAYPGWGIYGSSKAALEQLSAVLAAEQPDRRIYWVDPGDMRTAMHQAAFPGEDISDRPLPDASVPGLLVLLTGDLPSGRYTVRTLPEG